jgi:hypothetical protein
MKTLKIFLLSLTLLFSINTFAQTKEYTALLNKALNALYADLPNNCKNLYGNEDALYKGSFQSKITLPNSIENNFSTTNEYSIEFTSYTIAGDDKEKATTAYNNICKAVKACVINYKAKNYKLLIVETKIGKYPSITYKLENGPVEINEITISVFMHDVSNFEKKYRYRIGVGFYGETDKEELEKIDGCESGNCQNGKGIYKFTNGDMYEGDFKDGYADGEGKYTEKDGTVYTGSLKKGKWDGFGTTVFADGSNYTGNYVNDNREGKGTYTYANGDIIIGNFENGLAKGKGIIKYSNGNKYEGEFYDGYPDGQGKYTEKNGTVYTGGLKKGLWDGFGTTIFSNGNVYKGNYVNDKMEGKGTHTYANGNIFIGNYLNNKAEGKGTTTYANGDILEANYINGKIINGKYLYKNGNYYEGEFKNGKFEGQGKFYDKAANTTKEGIYEDNKFIKENIISNQIALKVEGCISGDCKNGKGNIKFSNGELYEGDFKNGKPEGQGKYTFNTGTIYNGSFKNGKCDGFGKMKYDTGETFEGDYDNGSIKKGLYTLTNGDFYNGEWKNNNYNGQGKLYTKATNTIDKGIFKDGVLMKETKSPNEKAVSEIAIPSKEYSNLLGKAINSLYADMPNNCKSLYGNQIENSKYTHQSKILFPNSIKNTIAGYDDFPLIFESNVTAGNDNEIAKQKQSEISKVILATIINYKNKNYTIKYLAAESREGIKPHYVYNLENGPNELEGVKIYLKLMSNPNDSKPYKFFIAMGVYKK